MVGESALVIYAFSEYELDTDRIELRRIGEPLAVEPQVFDVLTYLVTNRERVVSKNELLDNVWGDRFVSESALTSRIKAARRLVGDDGRNQAVIRTSHGRGYRFVAPVVARSGDLEPAGGVNASDAVGATLLAPTDPAVAGSRLPADAVPVRSDSVPVRSGSVAGSRQVWPMVGRGAVLEAVARAFSDRDRGGVVLTGAAGLGKTRLAEECLVAAGAGGVHTARVAGHPEAKEVSLAALAHLVPTEILLLVGPDGELDRTTLFHRARAAITALAPEGERLMLLVDDIDQLDELSRALIGSLVADRSVFVVVTLRSGQGPVPTVEHLRKDGHLEVIEVEALEPEAVETLLHRVLEGPVVADSLAELVGASLGNPGVLRQLVDTALASGSLVSAHGVWQLVGPLEPSASFESMLAARLDGVGGEARHAVELLAVAGELGLDLLVGLTAEDAVDELDQLGVVALRMIGRRSRIALAHPLYGEVVRRQLTSLRTRRLRRELAGAIESVGARRRDDEVRIVAWRLDGGGDIESGALVRAARLALLDRNYAAAQRLLDRAWLDDRSPEVAQLLAEVHFRLGHTDLVEELLSGIDPNQLSDLSRAAVARRRANNRFFGTTDYTGSFEILVETIGTVTDPEVRRSLEATLSQLLINGGQVSDSIRIAESVLDGASGGVRLEALRAHALALLSAGRSLHAASAVDEALALHAASAEEVDRPGLTMVLFTQALALAEQGAVDQARAAVIEARAAHPHGQATWLDTALGRVELLAGRPRSVRRAVAPVVNESRARGLGAAERWVLALEACGWMLEGDLDAASRAVERATSLEDGPRGLFHPDIDRAKAWLAAYRGDLDGATELLSWSADESRDRGAHGFELTLLHDIARFGVPERVADRVAALAPDLQGDLVEARALHVSGLAAADPDGLARAAESFEHCGAALFAAEATAAGASVLAEQGRDDEAAAATERAEALRSVGGVRLVSPALI